MRVFSIEGKFQQNGRYSNLIADFKGYFVLEESGCIKGYMEEQYASRYNPQRYIYGKYDEANNNLVYLKMAIGRKLSPLLYCFPDLEKDGCWTEFSPMFRGFFAWGQKENAKATIKEETEKKPDEIINIYKKIIDDNWEINTVLINMGVDKFMGDIKRFF